MQPVIAVLFTVFFAACAVGFAVYAIKGLLKDMKDAEVIESEESADESAEDSGTDDKQDDLSDDTDADENENEEEK